MNYCGPVIQLTENQLTYYTLFRKNPVHFKEFSHDDVEDKKDDEDDDRPECEYGTDCYRRNPLHLSEYKHTAPPLSNPGEKRTRTSSRKRGGKRKTGRILSSSCKGCLSSPLTCMLGEDASQLGTP